MKRSPLYSRSGRDREVPGDRADEPGAGGGTGGNGGSGDSTSLTSPNASDSQPSRPNRLKAFIGRHERMVLFGSGGAIVMLLLLLFGALGSDVPGLTQRDIDQAVLYTLENQPPGPSLESEAYRVIGPSIVQVRRLAPEDESEAPPAEDEGSGWLDPDEGSGGPGGEWIEPDEPGVEPDRPDGESLAVGTGVVIIDDGTILTNLHVVAGIDRLGVVFADGTESPARIVSVRPEMDLAVIQAEFLPDDLIPATLSSTADLRMGDRVIAVGFPFGIGPSLSSGVVSGLRREYWSREGDRILSNLIQFDAAANPGNSGGPLVTVDGFVVGIVTAILNPNNQRSFVGIGFAVPIEEAAEAAGRSPF